MPTFTLTPHPSLPASQVKGISGTIERTADGYEVRYLLDGDTGRLNIPGDRPARFADELWRHTCFEIFLMRRGEPGYLEFNFSPSGEWALYRFARYRERIALELPLELVEPAVKVHRSPTRLDLQAVVQLDGIDQHAAAGDLVAAISAVIEADDGSLSYWALRHPLPRPDFHHPDAFALDLDEIRN